MWKARRLPVPLASVCTTAGSEPTLPANALATLPFWPQHHSPDSPEHASAKIPCVASQPVSPQRFAQAARRPAPALLPRLHHEMFLPQNIDDRDLQRDSLRPKTAPARESGGSASYSPVASSAARYAPPQQAARTHRSESPTNLAYCNRRPVLQRTQFRALRTDTRVTLREEGTRWTYCRLRPVHGLVLRQLGAQAPLQLLAELGDFHSWHHDELAGQHLPRVIVVRQLAAHTAILAILIPAESPVRNGLRADELEAP